LCVLTRDKKLDVLESIESNGTGVRIRTAGVNLAILAPLIGKVSASTLCLEVDTGSEPKANFKVRVTMGDRIQYVNAVGNAKEIISRAMDECALPIITQPDIEKALTEAKENSSTKVRIAIRNLGLREHLPNDVDQQLRSLVMSNLEPLSLRADIIRQRVRDLRRSLRAMVLDDYLTKCVWLNKSTGQVGRIAEQATQGADAPRASRFEFEHFDVDDDEVSAFLCALQKDLYGDFLLDFREFANILPTPKREFPWLGPSLHVYKSDFRREYDLEEFYSLYSGFRALSQIGVPVLIYQGQNPLVDQTPVRFLVVSDRSINLLQGKILDGDVLQAGVRDWTAQDLVWR
jgi:hypothetical protein